MQIVMVTLKAFGGAPLADEKELLASLNPFIPELSLKCWHSLLSNFFYKTLYEIIIIPMHLQLAHICLSLPHNQLVYVNYVKHFTTVKCGIPAAFLHVRFSRLKLFTWGVYYHNNLNKSDLEM